MLRKRFEAAFSLLHREPWDFFQLHISETDRINHFFWEDYERDTPGYGRAFLSFYRTLDALIGELLSIVPAGAEVIVLSGNGFRRLRREIYLNRALEERGWLEFERGEGRRLGMISRDARAYSLAPGRVFMHLKGREPKGGISGSEEYRGYRDGVAADLLRLTDPENGQPLVSAVLKGEEVNRNPGVAGVPPAGLQPPPRALRHARRAGRGVRDQGAPRPRDDHRALRHDGDARLGRRFRLRARPPPRRPRAGHRGRLPDGAGPDGRPSGRAPRREEPCLAGQPCSSTGTG